MVLPRCVYWRIMDTSREENEDYKMKANFLIQNNISMRNVKICETINEVYDFLENKSADHVRIVAFEVITFKDGSISDGDTIFNKMFSFFKSKADMEKLLKTNIRKLEAERE